MENYTNQHLATHQNKVHSGSISAAPVPVNPGMKEGLAGHKSDFTATGCVGTGWILNATNGHIFLKIRWIKLYLIYSECIHIFSNLMYPVSWKIGNTGKILVVMYSIPYRYFGWCILHFECCIVIMDSVSHILASQDALEVMYVSQ